MPKQAAKKKNRPRSSTADLHLWLVPFTFERPRTKQRGSFQMVVEAVTPDDAIDRCHERLVELAATTALFKEPIKLYSDGLIRLTGRFDEPVLLNFELPDVEGRISNLMPEQTEHDAMMFVAEHDATGPIEPVVTFGIDDGEDESGMRLSIERVILDLAAGNAAEVWARREGTRGISAARSLVDERAPEVELIQRRASMYRCDAPPRRPPNPPRSLLRSRHYRVLRGLPLRRSATAHRSSRRCRSGSLGRPSSAPGSEMGEHRCRSCRGDRRR